MRNNYKNGKKKQNEFKLLIKLQHTNDFKIN